MLENVDVTRRAVAICTFALLTVYRPHKSHKFARHNPIEVSILNLLVVFVLPDVEIFVVVPSLLDSKLETLEAVLNGTFVVAFSLAGVSVIPKKAVHGSNFVPGLLCSEAESNNHEGSDQESAVGELHVVVGGLRVVEDPHVSRILLRGEKFVQLAAVTVDHCQVEGAEVLVEGHVGEVAVDVEEEGVVDIGRGLRVTDPVQLVYKVRESNLLGMISIGFPSCLSCFFKGEGEACLFLGLGVSPNAFSPLAFFMGGDWNLAWSS